MWICPACGRGFKRTNQSHYCGKAPASIDEYILRQEESIRPVLVRLKDAIHNAIPEAAETIAWSMPTWKKNDYIMHFAVNPKHISVYVGEEAIAHFSEELQGCDTHKGGIRFKYDDEIPFSLISDMAKWCFEMDRSIQTDNAAAPKKRK